MRYIFSTILFVFILTSVVQAQTGFVPGQTKFSTGIFFTPEAVFLGQLPEEVKLGSRISCSYGIQVRYSVNKNWSVSTGVQGSNKVFMAYVKVKNRNGTIVGNLKKKSSYAFVEFPLLLSYERAYNKNVSLYVSAGTLLGYLSHEKVGDPGAHNPNVVFDGQTTKIYQTNAYVYDRDDLNRFGYYKFLLSSYVGIGALIKLDRNISLLVQPNVKYAITNLHKKEPSEFPLQYSGRPYSFGLMAGFFIRI
jgi:hypothetical protein